MNNFEKIKDMSIKDFIKAINRETYGKWDEETITNWLSKEDTDWINIPKDTKVFVRNSLKEEWIPRYFARYMDNNQSYPYAVYREGKTSWSNEGKVLQVFAHCKLADEKDTSIKEILEERCINCASFEFCSMNKKHIYVDCISKYINDNFNISRKEKFNE